jgi:mannosyltransferase OCH1-like enzyme
MPTRAAGVLYFGTPDAAIGRAMIPKLIHQTAKTADIPSQWRPFQEKVIALHPGWTYRLWTDEDNARFVRDEFPDFVPVFEALPRKIMRIDVIRYLILYRHGGLYLDMDYEMLRPFDLLDHGCVLPLEKPPYTLAPAGQVCNCFMAAEPGHPFFRAVIDDLVRTPRVVNNDDDVIFQSGPLFLSRVLAELAGTGVSVHTPAAELFNRPTPATRREYDAVRADGVTYGIHHCTGVWRERTLVERVRARVGRLVRSLR